jgi:hypothetical protein
VTRPRTPFEDTSVSVARSQEGIRRLLQTAGALAVGFESTFGPDEPRCVVRFVWPLKTPHGTTTAQAVRLEVVPLPPGAGRSEEQRERQAWRGLAHYLEGTIKAATFGLIRFEDVFLSFLELDRDGTTLGDVVMGELERHGRLTLDAGRLELERPT